MDIVCQHCQSGDIQRRGFRGDKQRCLCNNCSKWFVIELDLPPIEDTLPEEYGELVNLKGNDRFIITSAQNNTPVDTNFWKSLLAWADYFSAQILVIPMLYKVRPETEIWWAPEVVPFLINEEIKLAKGVRVFGDLPISATAVNPLAGLESLSQGDSAIFGHTQIQMRTVATPQNRLPKILQTTGTTTLKNYKRGKAGKKGSFHHSLGAAIVELNDGIFFIRGITGNSNSEFYDLDLHCTPRGVKKIKQIEGIVVGDEHEQWNCPEVRAATFDDEDSIVNTLKPKLIIRHDVTDSYSISHHHKNSPSIQYQKHLTGMNNLRAELDATARFLEETTPKFARSVIVPSNHHDHISRWLEEIDWKAEPWNAEIYHDMWAAWLKAIREDESHHPYTAWLRKNCKADLILLTQDYPFIIKDIHIGFHGDRGANGARGSLTGWAKIGTKVIVGHTHSPGIEKGAYMVGTSSLLSLQYTHGPSSWMNTHCLILPDGKRQLIHIIDGEWRKS